MKHRLGEGAGEREPEITGPVPVGSRQMTARVIEPVQPRFSKVRLAAVVAGNANKLRRVDFDDAAKRARRRQYRGESGSTRGLLGERRRGPVHFFYLALAERLQRVDVPERPLRRCEEVPLGPAGQFTEYA